MLFKDSEKLKRYAQLAGKINFPSLEQTIRTTEILHLKKKVLGAAQYNELNEAYTAAADEASLSAIHKSLLENCRVHLGPLICYYYAPKADVQLGDAGMAKNDKAVYQYQATNFREAMLNEAQLTEELLLEFLEEHKADYPLWAESDTAAEYRSLFIKSGLEFEFLFPSSSPCRNYRAMRSKMLQVEEEVRKAIGETVFDLLKTKDQAGMALNDKEKSLRGKLKAAIANLTVGFSIPLLSVRIDADGITVMNQGYSSRDQDAKKSAAGSDHMNNIIQICITTGNTWLSDAKKYISDHAADFGLPVVVPVAACSGSCAKPSCRKGFFGLS